MELSRQPDQDREGDGDGGQGLEDREKGLGSRREEEGWHAQAKHVSCVFLPSLCLTFFFTKRHAPLCALCSM